MGILVGTSIVFLLPAIIIVWVLTGSLDFSTNGVLKGNIPNEYVPFLLALFAFGIGPCVAFGLYIVEKISSKK